MAGAPPRHSSGPSSVDQAEVDRFSAMAEAWWDPTGKFRPLHRFNPVRLGYIRVALLDHFGRTDAAKQPLPLAGLSLVDIGCGGGLVAEPMARLGASVTAIDASDKNIAIAQAHAGQSGLAIDYRTTTAEDLLASGARFDIVLNMEVVEHVADRAGFLASSAALLKPGGIMIVATLNKTPKAFALAVVGAEYVLRWLPRGTHEWRKFVRPKDLAQDLAANGVDLVEFIGVSYDPLADRWRLGTDLAVNYMGRFSKAA